MKNKNLQYAVMTWYPILMIGAFLGGGLLAYVQYKNRQDPHYISFIKDHTHHGDNDPDFNDVLALEPVDFRISSITGTLTIQPAVGYKAEYLGSSPGLLSIGANYGCYNKITLELHDQFGNFVQLGEFYQPYTGIDILKKGPFDGVIDFDGPSGLTIKQRCLDRGNPNNFTWKPNSPYDFNLVNNLAIGGGYITAKHDTHVSWSIQGSWVWLTEQRSAYRLDIELQ